MIIIATCNKHPEIGAGLALIVDALIAKGLQVQCLPWQHDDLQLFCQAKYVVPLCAWDYADNPADFKYWVNAVQAGGGNLVNSADTLLGNMKKSYLLELAEKGIDTTASRYLEQPTPEKLKLLSKTEGWDDMVLKPVYGQSGKLVTRYRPDINKEHAIFNSEQGILVQPFIDAIKTQGELALCFIAGVFSHAVCRMPAQGDWRANSQYQVSVYQVEVEQWVIEQAALSLLSLDEIPLYARVDGIVIDHRFVLCELELIEPALFFDRVKDPNKTQFSRLIGLLAR